MKSAVGTLILRDESNLIENMVLMQRKLRYADNVYFDFYHLCYYLSKSISPDPERKLIYEFKKYEESAVRTLIIESIQNCQHLDFDYDMMIVRALKSSETEWGEMGTYAMDRLGMTFADVFDCTYEPSAIYKKRVTRPVKSLSLAGRKAELADSYGFNSNAFAEYSRLLIIDDVVTTGATMCAIIEPVLKVNPNTDHHICAWLDTN